MNDSANIARVDVPVGKGSQIYVRNRTIHGCELSGFCVDLFVF